MYAALYQHQKLYEIAHRRTIVKLMGINDWNYIYKQLQKQNMFRNANLMRCNVMPLHMIPSV